MSNLSRHHIQIGRLGICWYDVWNKRWGLEVSWQPRQGMPWVLIDWFWDAHQGR